MIPVTRVVWAVPGSIISSHFLQFPFPPSSRSENRSRPCSQMAVLAPLKQNHWSGRGRGDRSSPKSGALGGLHGLDAQGPCHHRGSVRGMGCRELATGGQHGVPR